MSKQARWLIAEIERWRKEQIITADQAVRLRALYPESVARVSWGLIVFSGLGAVVVGLGVILLLAFNWDDIPKFGKLGLIFGAMIAAHAGGLWLRSKDAWRPDLGEAISLLGSILFGAGIWLVAQVYHIEEHFPNGFLIWGLGALAMAWALNSIPQALLATVTLTIWGCSEVLSFYAPVDGASLLVIAGVLPLVCQRKSALLLATLLVSLYLLTLFNADYWGGGAGAFTTAFSLSLLLLGLVKVLGEERLMARGVGVMRFFGLCGFLFCTYLLSFRGIVRDLLRWTSYHEKHGVGHWVYAWLLFGLAAAAWLWLLFKNLTGARKTVSNEEWLAPIALVYCQGLAVTGLYLDAQFVAIVFNLVFLGIATTWMVRGCREGRLSTTVLGSLIFAVLIFARYFDLFESLAVRGVVFLVLGAVLFGEGFYYRRMRLTIDDEEGGRL